MPVRESRWDSFQQPSRLMSEVTRPGPRATGGRHGQMQQIDEVRQWCKLWTVDRDIIYYIYLFNYIYIYTYICDALFNTINPPLSSCKPSQLRPNTHTHMHSTCRRFASMANCWWCSRSQPAAKRMETQSLWWLLLGTSCFAKLCHWLPGVVIIYVIIIIVIYVILKPRQGERSSENGNKHQETTALPCDGMCRWGEASDSLRLRYAAPTRLTVRRASFYDDTPGQVDRIRSPIANGSLQI